MAAFDLLPQERELTHDHEIRARLIALACTRPPDTEEGVRRERWTYRELGEQVGMSESQAHAILAAADLRPHLTEQWVMSELGPEFDVGGLLHHPRLLQLAQALGEQVGAYPRKPREQVAVAAGSEQQLAGDQERPALADHV